MERSVAPDQAYPAGAGVAAGGEAVAGTSPIATAISMAGNSFIAYPSGDLWLEASQMGRAGGADPAPFTRPGFPAGSRFPAGPGLSAGLGLAAGPVACRRAGCLPQGRVRRRRTHRRTGSGR